MQNSPLDFACEVVDGEERYRSVGMTDSGRLLVAIWTLRDGKGARRDRVSECPLQEALSREKTMKKQSKHAVPAFASEAEEAAWWYENRKSHDKEFTAAVESGEAQLLTREKLRERIEASKAKTPAHVISLRVPEADLAMARRQAEQKGLPYQTYIKSLLHETLAEREKRSVG